MATGGGKFGCERWLPRPLDAPGAMF